MHASGVRILDSRRAGEVRAGVSRLVRNVDGPVAMAQARRDRQAADGVVLGGRGEATARSVADGLDGYRQAAARMDDSQADPSQGAVAAGLFLERRDRVAQQQRSAAVADRARPELRDRHDGRVAPGRAVAAFRLAFVVQRQHQPCPVPEPAHPQAGRRGHRRRVAPVRGAVRAQPSRAGPVPELPDHGCRDSAAHHARRQRRVHAPGARPVRLRGRHGHVARSPAQVHCSAPVGHEADAQGHQGGDQPVPRGQRPVFGHRDPVVDQVPRITDAVAADVADRKTRFDGQQ